jgi:hypothetical protein
MKVDNNLLLGILAVVAGVMVLAWNDALQWIVVSFLSSGVYCCYSGRSNRLLNKVQKEGISMEWDFSLQFYPGGRHHSTYLA